MSELLKATRIEGARIGVVLENKFIPEEIAAYVNGFPLLGAEVALVSRLWYGDYKPAVTTFYSDVDPSDDPVWASPQKIDVRHDISQVRPGDFDAVVMAANYTSVRLRYPGDLPADPLTLDRVVADDDLVTGFSKHQVLPFIAAIAARISALRATARSGELVPLNPYA